MADFFDRLAPEWDDNPSEYHTRERLVSMMGLRPNSVIADIGCGRGVMFEHLLKTEPAKIFAVDISEQMLRLAKGSFRDKRVEYINDDFLDAELPPLDAAVIFNAYPHFLDKAALAKRLSETVKSGGMVVIAHSRGRHGINGAHIGERVSKLSVPLQPAKTEAGRFGEFFTTDTLTDEDEIYFIKLVKRAAPAGVSRAD